MAFRLTRMALFEDGARTRVKKEDMMHRSPLAFSLTVLLLAGPASAQAPAAPGAPPPTETKPEPEPAQTEPEPEPSAPPPTATPGVMEASPDKPVAPEATAPPASEPGANSGANATSDAALSEDAATEGAVVATESPAPTGADMVVTGTRIRQKTAFAPSAPVEVIDRKALEQRGATSLAEVVQYMSVAQGSGYDGDAGGAGTASINLRGLGPGATLVLINGRRLHYSAGGTAEHFGDISVIPMSAVERIEVLKGGSSAIYGSDAIAGVVNVITRKNWDGARFQVSGQGTQDLDMSGHAGSAAFGSTSERSRVLGAVQYGFLSELTADELDWTKGRYQSRAGYPGSYIVGLGTVPDPQCEEGPHSSVVETSTGALCALDGRSYTSIAGRGERVSALFTAEYDVTDHTSAFGEVLVARLRGDARYSTYPLPAPYPVVPADHPDNPFGQDAAVIFRLPGKQRNTADDDTFRGVIGLRGDLEGAGEDTFLEAWEWEVYASYGISRYRQLIHDNVRANVQAALDGCADNSDESLCFNPFQSANNGTGTPNSQAVFDFMQGEMEVLNNHALQTYSGGMSGPIVELPGGDLAVAFGAEMRNEWRTTEIDQIGNLEGYGFVLGNSDAAASREVYGSYLEVRWPFFDGFELQTAGRLERYTDIGRTALSPSAGITFVPSQAVGRDNAASWWRKLQFRAHGTRAFRAPTIYQSFPGRGSTIPTAVTFPGDPRPTFIPVTNAGNPDLEEEKAWALSTGFAWQPIDELSLSSDFWLYDYEDKIFQVTPAQILGAHFRDLDNGGNGDPRVEIDPISGDIGRIRSQQINVPGSIVTYGLDFGVMFSLSGKSFGGGENDWGKVGVGALGTWTMSYSIPRERAANRVLPDGSTLPPLDCSGDSCEVVGKRNDSTFAPPIPALKMNIPVTYDNSGHSVGVIPRLITGVKDDAAPPMDGTQPDLPPWVTIDLQYGYTLYDWLGKELTLRIGVINVADTPPVTTRPGSKREALAYEPLLYDPRGRVFYASAISQF